MSGSAPWVSSGSASFASRTEVELSSWFGKRGVHLQRLAQGIDEEPVTPDREPTQLSSETTFAADVFDLGDMHEALRELAGDVADRLRRRGLRGRVVTLKARYPDFETVTRSRTEPRVIDDGVDLYQVAADLLTRTAAARRGVRLLGLGLSAFAEVNETRIQLDLFRDHGPGAR